jgi:Rrf2 family iron-sulfur cluster assembly transcriptional regulator
VRLTRKASYGLIAILALARRDLEAPVPAASIAADYDLPAPFVEKILRQLSHAGLVRSRPGRGGGYALASGADQLSVREVLTALGEPIDLVDCLDPAAPGCRLHDSCPTRRSWQSINSRFQELLDSLSIADLAPEASLDPGSIDPIPQGDGTSAPM